LTGKSTKNRAGFFFSTGFFNPGGRTSKLGLREY
jgi:hypothetical protein